MKPEFFDILRKIHKDPEASQRALAKELGLSIGKLNYCLRALKEKGFIKIKNFSKSKKKIKYLYFLTPKGALEKTNVTISYMKKKMQDLVLKLFCLLLQKVISCIKFIKCLPSNLKFEKVMTRVV